ncbi:unnamed protein product [Caenorhabditis auriculariae]|uniref:Uncharacterized protein n=1 Tax=Caenorhabditis auriculariae TaxID=2777116 RepID=A0A8S1H756_9PELO|nr:unnamed protein product [Caenorhabditis auriculariae]
MTPLLRSACKKHASCCSDAKGIHSNLSPRKFNTVPAPKPQISCSSVSSTGTDIMNKAFYEFEDEDTMTDFSVFRRNSEDGEENSWIRTRLSRPDSPMKKEVIQEEEVLKRNIFSCGSSFCEKPINWEGCWDIEEYFDRRPYLGHFIQLLVYICIFVLPPVSLLLTGISSRADLLTAFQFKTCRELPVVVMFWALRIVFFLNLIASTTAFGFCADWLCTVLLYYACKSNRLYCNEKQECECKPLRQS